MISSIRSLAADAYRSDKHILWHAITRIAFACYCYWKALYQFLILDHKYNTNLGNIANLPVPDDIWAHTYFYSLALIFKLWKRPHYRNTSFQQDCKDTLANVAIPGTGIPLSLFFYSYYSALFLVLFVNPMICLAGAMNKAYLEYSTLTQFMLDTSNYFESHLFHPQGANGYANENKWHFLTLGESLQVPVSPFLPVQEIVVKNIHIEGGLGIHFYKNAAAGGDFIIQERLHNATWLNELLPDNAPLSTMRVITTSTWSLKNTGDEKTCITPVSAVLRLGRAKALTDHSSVLFDVDIASGVIGKGRSNAHWYRLGKAAVGCPWLPDDDSRTVHPDAPWPQVTGRLVEGMANALSIVTSAHYSMMKDVPIAGWDVAFTTQGVYLLEVNLSCNFFRGSFDLPAHIAFVASYFKSIETASIPSSSIEFKDSASDSATDSVSAFSPDASSVKSKDE